MTSFTRKEYDLLNLKRGGEESTNNVTQNGPTEPLTNNNNNEINKTNEVKTEEVDLNLSKTSNNTSQNNTSTLTEEAAPVSSKKSGRVLSILTPPVEAVVGVGFLFVLCFFFREEISFLLPGSNKKSEL